MMVSHGVQGKLHEVKGCRALWGRSWRARDSSCWRPLRRTTRLWLWAFRHQSTIMFSSKKRLRSKLFCFWLRHHYSAFVAKTFFKVSCRSQLLGFFPGLFSLGLDALVKEGLTATQQHAVINKAATGFSLLLGFTNPAMLPGTRLWLLSPGLNHVEHGGAHTL